jgi:hypothetical protein
MTDTEPQPKPEPTERSEPIIERRSASEVALVATPVAIVVQPVIGALANKLIGSEQPSDPPPQEPQAPAE